jgi:hypothetical protein
MATKIQARRDTAANWTSVNPVLAAGEPGFESDTGKFKFGDGTTAWNSLAYFAGGSTPADLSITPRMLTDGARVGAQQPTGTIAATGPRRQAAAATPMTGSAASGTISWWLLDDLLPAQRALTAIRVTTKAAGLTITHAFAALADLAGNLLGTTEDLPPAIAGGTWSADVPVDFRFATTLGGSTVGPITTPNTPGGIPAYVGLCLVGGTMPTMEGFTGSIGMNKDAPVICGPGASGLTTPASLVSAGNPTALPAAGVASSVLGYAAVK